MMSSYPNPFDALFALQRALDARLASDWMGAGTAAGGSYPPVNVFQQEDDFVVVVELPGVAKSDLHIEAKENAIRIGGKKEVRYQEDASVHRRERIHGVFDRTIASRSRSTLTAFAPSTATPGRAARLTTAH
jgi:HSP20 family protein